MGIVAEAGGKQPSKVRDDALEEPVLERGDAVEDGVRPRPVLFEQGGVLPRPLGVAELHLVGRVEEERVGLAEEPVGVVGEGGIGSVVEPRVKYVGREALVWDLGEEFLGDDLGEGVEDGEAGVVALAEGLGAEDEEELLAHLLWPLVQSLVVPAHPSEGDLVDDVGVALEVVGDGEVAADPFEEATDPSRLPGLDALLVSLDRLDLEDVLGLLGQDLADDATELGLGLVALEEVAKRGRCEETGLEEKAESGERWD